MIDRYDLTTATKEILVSPVHGIDLPEIAEAVIKERTARTTQPAAAQIYLGSGCAWGLAVLLEQLGRVLGDAGGLKRRIGKKFISIARLLLHINGIVGRGFSLSNFITNFG